MGCKLQIALDFSSMDNALSVARAVSPWVDIMEAGTPLIKSVGLDVVRRLREEYPGKLIVADMKSTDVGAFEADLAFQAGADFTVASGVTTLATIRGVQKEAERWGRRCIVDLTGVDDVVARCKELTLFGVNLVLVHRSIDEEVSSGSVWTDEARSVVGDLCAMGLDVMTAGGLGEATIPLFCEYPLYAIVVGREITSSEDPAMTAERLAHLIGNQWPD